MNVRRCRILTRRRKPAAEAAMHAAPKPHVLRRGVGFGLIFLFAWAALPPAPALAESAGDARTRVLIVVGPSNHPPGTHEVAAGGRLIKHCLEHAGIEGLTAEVRSDWPSESDSLQQVQSVVFIGDQFPPHQMPDSPRIMADLKEMTSRGCGIACIHFATGLRNPDVQPDGDHPLLHWIGGYFASRCEHHQSIARIFKDAVIEPAGDRHEVLRGWKTFTLTDEPYIENYFGPPGWAEQAGVIEFASSMLPPEAPKRQVVAWGIERPDGGRGFGIVMPHFYENWQLDDLRTLILNGIVWSARREVPESGVRVELPPLESFDPDAVRPRR